MVGLWVQVAGLWVQVVGLWVQVAGLWVQVVGLWVQVVGLWVQVAGLWVQVAGLWVQVAGNAEFLILGPATNPKRDPLPKHMLFGGRSLCHVTSLNGGSLWVK